MGESGLALYELLKTEEGRNFAIKELSNADLSLSSVLGGIGSGIQADLSELGEHGGNILGLETDPATRVYSLGYAGGRYGTDLTASSSLGVLVKQYDVVPYKPSNAPLENHHGVLDVWSKIIYWAISQEQQDLLQ